MGNTNKPKPQAITMKTTEKVYEIILFKHIPDTVEPGGPSEAADKLQKRALVVGLLEQSLSLAVVEAHSEQILSVAVMLDLELSSSSALTMMSGIISLNQSTHSAYF